MPHCVNLSCRLDLKDEWVFCPKCGVDNRPPEERRKVDVCDHQIETGEFCVLCGVSILDQNEEEPGQAVWREIAGWVLLVGGVLMIVVSQVLMRDYQAPHATGRNMNLAALLARLAFLFMPCGIILILSSPVRWRFFRRR